VGADLAKLEELLALENNDDGLLVTNATSTSKGLLTALVEGMTAAKALIAKELPRDEEEVKSLAIQLVGKDVTLENVTPSDIEFVKRIYSTGGNGYVAYVVVINTRYNRVETETLIHVGNNGKIVAVEKLTWKTSPHIESDYGSYTPPTPEQVDALYAQLTGRNSTTIDAVELITGSTQNSSALTGSIKEALLAIDELIVKYTEPDYTARIIGISILAAALVVSVAAAIVIKKKRGGKNG
jgi:uncharacterized protein YuzE